MSYAKLSEGSGIQWPCNEKYPNGTPHLYTDLHFATDYDNCEAFGYDLDTGAAITAEQYKLIDPKGKAFLKSTDYQPPYEEPDGEYPLWLTTGRVVYQFHTRTKTGRSKELCDAAPDSFVQISEEDAATYGIEEGDMVEVTSRRGSVLQPAVIGNIEQGIVFIPFHYGYWDDDSRSRAANELTYTDWDPISKQPHFKYSAVKIRKVAENTWDGPSEKAEHMQRVDNHNFKMEGA
jgi:predicted molibdopterin-dependent oxidoreductase YjgC